MEDVIPEPPMNFSNRYLQGSRRMPNYRYQCKQTYTTVPAFLASRKLPHCESQHMRLHAPNCSPPKNVPAWEKSCHVPAFSLPRATVYHSRRCPGRLVYRNPKLHFIKTPMQTYVNTLPPPRVVKIPYTGMTKGPHGPIIKGSLPCVTTAPVPQMTKGPVVCPAKGLQPCVAKGTLPRMSKGPVAYPAKSPQPSVTRGTLPRMTKGPVLYSAKGSQQCVTNGSQQNVTKGPLPSALKGTLPRVTKGPRLIATKAPRFSGLTASRSFLRRGSRAYLTKGSQPSLAKGSQPSLNKGSRLCLKGSQPSLARAGTFLAKRLSKNVKIASTGKRYTSATKWPF